MHTFSLRHPTNTAISSDLRVGLHHLDPLPFHVPETQVHTARNSAGASAAPAVFPYSPLPYGGAAYLLEASSLSSISVLVTCLMACMAASIDLRLFLKEACRTWRSTSAHMRWAYERPDSLPSPLAGSYWTAPYECSCQVYMSCCLQGRHAEAECPCLREEVALETHRQAPPPADVGGAPNLQQPLLLSAGRSCRPGVQPENTR